jgi:hypothetical protein
MPAIQRGHARRLPSGKWQLRYRDNNGVYQAAGVFASKSAALNHYRDVIAPSLTGDPVAPPDLTLAGSVEVFLTPARRNRCPLAHDRHASAAARLRHRRLRRRAALAAGAHEPTSSQDGAPRSRSGRATGSCRRSGRR